MTITPEEYYNHLLDSDLESKMDLNRLDNKLTDGFYIENRDNTWYYIFNDRKSRVFEKKFDSYEKLVRYLANYRLKLYAPKYKKKLKNYAQHRL